MSAQELITEHLDLWTEAVTKKSTSGRGSNGKIELTGIKKLRELILELAVRGKLVEQNPTDEPAIRLLSKTKALREQLIVEGKLRRQKQAESTKEIEKPYEIPDSWCWASLPDVASYNPGKTPSTKAPQFWATGTSGIPWVSIADLNHNSSVRDTSKAVTQIAASEVFRSEPTAPGTILMSFKLTVGKVSINEVPVYHNEAIISIFPFSGVNRDYLFKVLPMLALGGKTKRAIMGNTLNATSLAQILVPLPPQEEQHRIVQKIDELMALCDQLEQQTSDHLAAHETLVDTLLGTLTQSENANELAENWARLATHFDTLFTTEQSIDKLKQTILQLAVMGRLVEQDAEDEPVTALLERISKQNDQLSNSGRKNAMSCVNERDEPFQLPSKWQFKRLGDLSHVFAGNSFKSQDFNDISGTRVIKITNVGVGELVETQDYLPAKFSEQYSKYQVMTGDLVLALTRPYISSGLKIAICPDIYNKALLNQRVAAIRPFLDRSFIYLYMQSVYVLGLYQARFGGSGLQPNLKMDDVTNLIIPVPPMAEQHRIVHKVDDLMALCDQLKERLNQASETRCQLAEAVVSGATS